MLKERILHLRKKRNLSQQQLADAVGVDRTTVVHWEKGSREPSKLVLEKIGDYFDVSTDYLLGVITEKEEHLLKDLKEMNIKKILESDYKISWDGVELTEEDKKQFLVIAMGIVALKKQAKQ